MEYLPEGDLLHYLRERKKSEVDLSTKMTIALDIAKGMCPRFLRALTHTHTRPHSRLLIALHTPQACTFCTPLHRRSFIEI
jgi:hypothetical protein